MARFILHFDESPVGFHQPAFGGRMRRDRDSNPGYPLTGIHTFQACLFNHSSISPEERQIYVKSSELSEYFSGIFRGDPAHLFFAHGHSIADLFCNNGDVTAFVAFAAEGYRGKIRGVRFQDNI